MWNNNMLPTQAHSWPPICQHSHNYIFYFFLYISVLWNFNEMNMISCFFFGLTLIPADTLFVLDREKMNTDQPCVPLKTKDKHNSEPFVFTCCSTHLLLCCAVRWKIVFWVEAYSSAMHAQKWVQKVFFLQVCKLFNKTIKLKNHWITDIKGKKIKW